MSHTMEIDTEGRVSQTTKSRQDAVKEHANCAYSSPRTFQLTSIYMFETHVERLFKSYEKNGQVEPVTKDEIRRVIIDHGRIYLFEMKQDVIIYVFLNYKTKKFSSFCRVLHEPSNNSGATLVQLERPDPHIKDMTWVNMRDEYEKQLTEQNVEFIMYNSDGIVTECLFSNVFIVDKDGTVITPPESLVLQGTMRSGVIKMCEKHNIPFKEACFTKDYLLNNDTLEVFITSSVVGALPLASVNGVPKQQKISKIIQEKLPDVIIEQCTTIIE